MTGTCAPPKLKGGADRIAEALSIAVPGLTALNLRRLTGGSSHETWAFDGAFQDGGSVEPLILRREFSHALFEMSCETEFALLSKLHEAGAKVPRPMVQAGADSALGTPFMIIERMAGSDARNVIAQGGVSDLGELGRAIVQVLVELHAQDVSLFSAALPPVASSIDQLEQWEPAIRGASVGGILPLAVDWVRRNAFRIDDPLLVHGDFKANNILLDDTGRLTVIDWELAHLGDPLEDLAWTALWSTSADLVGGMLSFAELLDTYSDLSGRPIDADRMRYWQIFSLVKLASIFLKGLETEADTVPRPMLVMLAQALPCIEEALGRLLLGQTNRS